MPKPLKLTSKNPTPRGVTLSEKGFTLVETMVGTLIFTIAMVALLGTTMMAYRYMLISRYQERAMNILTTIADQFQNSPIVVANTLSSTPTIKDFFTLASAPTCSGMAWDTDRQYFMYPNETSATSDNYKTGGTVASPTAGGLIIPLSTVTDTNTEVTANVTRTVVKVLNDPYQGSAAQNTSEMILGTFSLTYTFLGTQTLTVSVLRTITPTDAGKNTNATTPLYP